MLRFRNCKRTAPQRQHGGIPCQGDTGEDSTAMAALLAHAKEEARIEYKPW